MSTETVVAAAIQCSLSDDEKTNVDKISHLVSLAAKEGANIILPSELFQGHYFCKEEKEIYFARALPAANHPMLLHFQKLAKQLGVILPVSFFEREGPAYFNSVAIFDANGECLGVYRKSHIPDGPGYEEKYYFNPGNTGFHVWNTRFGKVGVGICWDQWFPECARAMVLKGAEILLYPTAIGSEPGNPDPLVTKNRWQRAMIGHAVSNVVPVVAANRVGDEGTQFFYGHSFLCDEAGNLVRELPEGKEGTLLAEFDLSAIGENRAAWGFFRDRRPDLYQCLVER